MRKLFLLLIRWGDGVTGLSYAPLPSASLAVTVVCCVSGVLCETNVRLTSACDPNPCEAGGTCISLASGEFLCRCPIDRDGERCQHCKCHSEVPVSIQTHETQALALRAMRALRIRKTQATQALGWLLRWLAACIDHSYWLALAFVA